MRRLLIIGLDGATFDVILPWVEQGKLPKGTPVPVVPDPYGGRS